MQALFETTDHMAGVLGDLERVIAVTHEFGVFFRGPELMAVAHNREELGAIIAMADRLATPLGRLHYNAYDRARAPKWRADLLSFETRVGEIETATETFIHGAFATLRSFDGAFNLLEKLREMEMRDSLRDLVHANAGNIVAKARSELADTAALFSSLKDSPPVPKSSPPVAGAIEWANALFLKQKKPILRIKSVPALWESPSGSELRSAFVAFSRDLDGYIRGIYSRWCGSVVSRTPDLLRAPILGPSLLDFPLRPRDALPDIGKGRPQPGIAVAAAAAAAATLQYPHLSLDRASTCMPLPPYYVNFSPELRELAAEVRLLDRLGFPVPEVAMTAALQEETHGVYCARLSALLDRYHAALESVAPIEANLLQVCGVSYYWLVLYI